MQKSVFLHEFRQSFGLRLTDDYILFRKPLELYNLFQSTPPRRW